MSPLTFALVIVEVELIVRLLLKMGKDSISRLYIGHLPPDTNEDSFRTYLAKTGVKSGAFNIVIKKGYGFMECRDQATADLLIGKA